nr:uncharacterized protein LOC111774661 [Equus caballus]
MTGCGRGERRRRGRPPRVPEVGRGDADTGARSLRPGAQKGGVTGTGATKAGEPWREADASKATAPREGPGEAAQGSGDRLWLQGPAQMTPEQAARLGREAAGRGGGGRWGTPGWERAGSARGLGGSPPAPQPPPPGWTKPARRPVARLDQEPLPVPPASPGFVTLKKYMKEASFIKYS